MNRTGIFLTLYLLLAGLVACNNGGSNPSQPGGGPSDPNRPTISLSGPSTVRFSGPITLTASLSSEKTVAKVEWYEGQTKLGEQVSPPIPGQSS